MMNLENKQLLQAKLKELADKEKREIIFDIEVKDGMTEKDVIDKIFDSVKKKKE